MKENVSSSCPDCGQNPVHHGVEWLSAFFDSILAPIGNVIDARTAKVRNRLTRARFIDQVGFFCLRFAVMLKLATITYDVDGFDSGRNRCLWESAKKRGIVMQQFRILGRTDGMTFFVAARDGKLVVFEGLPRPDRRVSPSLNWMDNKATMKRRFRDAGIPVARGRACFRYAQALKTFREIGGPTIVKPHIGSRGRHTTIHIDTPERLRDAFYSAKKLSPWVVVEEELSGRVFRILLIRGKVAAIVRREEPHIIGDGKTTIKKLVEKENKNPAREGPIFHKLRADSETEQELARQGLHLDSVPEPGRVVSLNTHVSRYYGASTTDFTDRAHPDNVKLFELVAATLADSLVGIDFIIDDMGRSWREQERCGVIECNSLPNIDLHHDVLYGENRDAAGMLLDIAFGSMVP